MTGSVKRIYEDGIFRADVRILHRAVTEDYPPNFVSGLPCTRDVKVGDTVLFYVQRFDLGNNIEEWRATNLAKLDDALTS
jgi:hypothetical protein